ncbi:hypothetical protein H696_01888 [Fonticula alba]|uniref:RRM domain-containing protein n=1 Tax=Fonticula alba TaxID=691883 RepID=A0A058ZA06_FONAL|nr:hypothetical protein H696_01888 [Fonticula alba]KCV70941.1 hypothetical protein H696_01888 [Fonticula alba]|eukprot:XP_009494065.1 hypothetical protein H696_01888 [Fonticula alba]
MRKMNADAPQPDAGGLGAALLQLLTPENLASDRRLRGLFDTASGQAEAPLREVLALLGAGPSDAPPAGTLDLLALTGPWAWDSAAPTGGRLTYTAGPGLPSLAPGLQAEADASTIYIENVQGPTTERALAQLLGRTLLGMSLAVLDGPGCRCSPGGAGQPAAVADLGAVSVAGFRAGGTPALLDTWARGLGLAPGSPPSVGLSELLAARASPVLHVSLPRDEAGGGIKGYAFVEYASPEVAKLALSRLQLIHSLEHCLFRVCPAPGTIPPPVHDLRRLHALRPLERSTWIQQRALYRLLKGFLAAAAAAAASPAAGQISATSEVSHGDDDSVVLSSGAADPPPGRAAEISAAVAVVRLSGLPSRGMGIARLRVPPPPCCLAPVAGSPRPPLLPACTTLHMANENLLVSKIAQRLFELAMADPVAESNLVSVDFRRGTAWAHFLLSSADVAARFAAADAASLLPAIGLDEAASDVQLSLLGAAEARQVIGRTLDPTGSKRARDTSPTPADAQQPEQAPRNRPNKAKKRRAERTVFDED